MLDAIEMFGIHRCMFATNFPVAGLRVDFDTLVRSVSRMLEHVPAAGRRQFFWENAAKFYRIEVGVPAT